MPADQAFEDLVKAGWGVLESDFRISALMAWKRKAHSCLSDLLGPQHADTLHFLQYVNEDTQ